MRRCVVLMSLLALLIAACGEKEALSPTEGPARSEGGQTATPPPTASVAPTSTVPDEANETPDGTATGGKHAIIGLDGPSGSPVPTSTFLYDWPLDFEGHEIAAQEDAIRGLLLSAADLPDDLAWQPDEIDNLALWPRDECAVADLMIPAPSNIPVLSASFISADGGVRVDHVVDAKIDLPDAGAQIMSTLRQFEDMPGCYIFAREDAGARIIDFESLDISQPLADVSLAYRVRLDLDGDLATAERDLIIAYARIHHVMVALQYQDTSQVSDREFEDLINHLSERIVSSLRDTIGQQLIARIPTATPTYPPVDPVPEMPPIPEITTCEQAGNLILERFQIYLDAIAPLPEEALFSDEQPKGLEELLERLNADLETIRDEAENIDCRETELNWWIAEGIDGLVASGPGAEAVLEYLKGVYSQAETSPPIVFPTITPDWEIATCQDAADVFLEKTQVFLDSVTGMSVEEFESTEEPTPEVLRYIAEVRRIVEDYQAIGCTEAEMEALILSGLDALTVDGEWAESFVEELREGSEQGGLFDDLY